ncbi:serine/threonine protein kinase [candidate division KSB1 bacterium]|nr:serine/threonine protein kinase [candidate division KSB1 bacterium]
MLQRGDLALSYRARDVALERDVFIKVLNPALAKDAEIRARFEREAKAVARLDHPNLVRIYEYGEDADEGLYMLLEWIAGSNLGQRLAQGPLPAEDVERLARDMLAGLAALHSVGILHRDLKPDNVLVAENSRSSTDNQDSEQTPLNPPTKWGEIRYKITDFSLATLRDAPSLTHHEAIVGTPAYMAPEQAAGGKLTEQSDLFSLGVVLYEAATGTNPLVGETMLETLRKIRESDVSFEHARINALTPELRKVLGLLLKKNAAERPDSAKSALAMLDGVAEVATSAQARSRKRDSMYLGAAVILLLIWVVYMTRSDTDEPKQAQRADSSIAQPVGASNDTGAAAPDTSLTPVTKITTAAQLFTGDGDRSGELRAPVPGPPPVLTKPEPDVAAHLAVADSIDVWLTTDPWAYVSWHGEQIATTPLPTPLRLPRGTHSLQLRNPAFPAVNVEFALAQSRKVSVRLADYVALVRINASPWAECYLDGEHLGTTPLAKPPLILPGRHTVKLSHPSFPPQQREFTAAGGDTITIDGDMSRAQLAVKSRSLPQ